jgi:hypothetical protein
VAKFGGILLVVRPVWTFWIIGKDLTVSPFSESGHCQDTSSTRHSFSRVPGRKDPTWKCVAYSPTKLQKARLRTGGSVAGLRH